MPSPVSKALYTFIIDVLFIGNNVGYGFYSFKMAHFKYHL
jgi:hypothetical protein